MTARVLLAAAVDGRPVIPLVVPLGAVIDQGNGPLVWVVSAGKANPRKVKVAQFGETGVTITEGLQAGELVVIAGASKLEPGQAVEAKTASPPAQQR